MAKLDRDKVIRAALELLNEVGVDALTTRKLAEKLQVQQPALYWHFQNKEALLSALAEAMLAERHTHCFPAQGESWQEFLTNNARSFRAALLAYRDGARIHAGTGPSSPQYAAIEAQVRLLCAAGFSGADALRVLMTISHYTVGAVLEQQNTQATAINRGGELLCGAEAPEFLRHFFSDQSLMDAEPAFDYGLAAMIHGFTVLLHKDVGA